MNGFVLLPPKRLLDLGGVYVRGDELDRRIERIEMHMARQEKNIASRLVALVAEGIEPITVKREALAMTMLLTEPEIEIEELARRTRVSRRTLYNWGQVGQVLRGRRQDRGRD